MPVIDPISVPPPIGAEHVIYSYDPARRPTIRYRSLPSMQTGEASTLDAARSSFRTDLARWLHLDRRGLPVVTEHLEAVVNGIGGQERSDSGVGFWVRTKVGAVHRDRCHDRMFLQTLLKDGAHQDEWRLHLRAAESAGVTPVVVIVEAEDCVGSVLDQMTALDVAWVTYSDPRDTLGWVGIYGASPSPGTPMPVVSDDPALRGMEVHALATAFPGRRTVRVLNRKDNDQ